MKDHVIRVWKSGHPVQLIKLFQLGNKEALFRRGCMRKACGESFISTYLRVFSATHNTTAFFPLHTYLNLSSPPLFSRLWERLFSEGKWKGGWDTQATMGFWLVWHILLVQRLPCLPEVSSKHYMFHSSLNIAWWVWPRSSATQGVAECSISPPDHVQIWEQYSCGSDFTFR